MDPFPEHLAELRRSRRWSQERAAARCAMDHSLISRLEAGNRAPTRQTMAKIAAGFALDRTEADALHAAAGYLPPSLAGAGEHLATVCAAARALGDDGVHRDALATALDALITLHRLARGEPRASDQRHEGGSATCPLSTPR